MLQGDTLAYKVNNKKTVLMSHFLVIFRTFSWYFFFNGPQISHWS